MRRLLGCLLAAAGLAACGPSAKVDPALSGGDHGNGQRQGRACEGDYSPISLFAPNLLPVENPENLPEGTYESHGLEYYVRDEGPGGVIQVHFSETRMEESPLTRQVCQGGPRPDLAVEYAFPALQLLSVGPQGKSRVDATYLIQGQRGRYTSGRVGGTRTEATGLAGLLAQFTQARLYQMGAGTYELRGLLREQKPEGLVSKWVLQRISLVKPR